MVDESTRLYRNLRQCKLDDLLLSIGDVSRGMLKRKKPIETVRVTTRSVGRLVQHGNVTVAAWDLTDLAYHAIQVTHDFAQINPSIDDLVALINDLHDYNNDPPEDHLGSLPDAQILRAILVGLSQKQFWYQEVHRIRAEFNRQIELLEVIPTRVRPFGDFDDICTERTGLDMSGLRVALFGLFALNSAATDLESALPPRELDHIHPVLTCENLNRVAFYYSADYAEFRGSKFCENHFFGKPIVRTSRNRLLVPNAYLLLRKLADGPLWILREHYRAAGSAHFVNEFGRLLETYVEDMLRIHLCRDMVLRVPEVQYAKRADWIIITSSFRIIVELKAAIAGMMIKRMYPSVPELECLVDRLSMGLLQLDETERAYPDPSRATTKFLVHYDSLFVADGLIRPAAVERRASELASTENLFFCDIEEFEWFISVLGQSEQEAESILDTKITTQHNPAIGIELHQVIPQHSTTANRHNHVHLAHWDNFLPKLHRFSDDSDETRNS